MPTTYMFNCPPNEDPIAILTTRLESTQESLRQAVASIDRLTVAPVRQYRRLAEPTRKPHRKDTDMKDTSVISCLGIRMLIHFYTYPTPWPEPSIAANALSLRFQKEGLAEARSGDPYQMYLTERGVAYIHALRNTPFPERVIREEWVDPRFE